MLLATRRWERELRELLANRSSLFKAHVLPATMPPGWTQSWPELTDRENSWYTHHYIDDSTGEERQRPDGSPDPPPCTYSLSL